MKNGEKQEEKQDEKAKINGKKAWKVIRKRDGNGNRKRRKQKTKKKENWQRGGKGQWMNVAEMQKNRVEKV